MNKKKMEEILLAKHTNIDEVYDYLNMFEEGDIINFNENELLEDFYETII